MVKRIMAVGFLAAVTATQALNSTLYNESSLRKAQEIILPENGQEGIQLAFGSCYGIFEHKSDIFD